MEEKKKKNTGLIVLVVILILVVIGMGVYILSDKGVVKIFNAKIEEKSSSKSSTKTLDINSTIVLNLYDTVTSDPTCIKDYLYSVYDGSKETYYDDFNVKNGSEVVKMKIVGKNISKIKRYEKHLLDSSDINKIPDRNSLNMYSFESYNKVIGENSLHLYNYGYEKKYVEQLYKSIFGKDAKLDTSVDIILGKFSTDVLTYVEALDMYVIYYIDGGGTCGPTTYETELIKAEMNNNTITIYEKSEYCNYETDKRVVENTTNYKYTFEKSYDGYYKFVSRKIVK